MMKILIVDDEREEREGIAYLIEKYGYPAETVQSLSMRSRPLRQMRSVTC